MKTVGIISEFNPFHSGHAHLIQKAREQSGADFVVIIMSGDFVQRGEPAVFHKYERTKQALAGGADLVFELPVRFCLSSAGDFARGGVLALTSLGFVTDLYFGSECGELSPLMDAARILHREETIGCPAYSDALQTALKQGCSFPAARAKALSLVSSVPTEILKEPNNILGMEYCHALLSLGSPIVPHTIRRTGRHYHDPEAPAGAQHPSSTALRREIYASETPHLCLDDCSQSVAYALLCKNDLTEFKDISPDLAQRMKKCLDSFESVTGFVRECQTRTFTESRIRRALLQCVLGITDTGISMPYLRLLGMKKRASHRLAHVSEGGSVKILSRLAHDSKQLDRESQAFLSVDLLAADWYRQIWREKYKEPMPNEFQRSVLTEE